MSQNQINIHIGRTKIFNTQHLKLQSHDFRQHLFFSVFNVYNVSNGQPKFERQS